VAPLEPTRANKDNVKNAERAADEDKEKAKSECLREIKEYQDFMYHFAGCAVRKVTFGKMKGRKKLSEILTVGEEGYLVLAYVNAYDSWMHVLEKKDNETIPAKRFTSDSKGAARYGGWSEEGIKLHKNICEKLQEQRADTTNERLKKFEEELMERFKKDKQGNKNQKTAEKRVPVFHQLDMSLMRKRKRSTSTMMIR
jgi:hypothetical protein